MVLGLDAFANSILTASAVATVLVHLDKFESLLQIAGVWFVASTAMQTCGLSESHTTAVFASLLGLKVVPMLLKRLLTMVSLHLYVRINKSVGFSQSKL